MSTTKEDFLTTPDQESTLQHLSSLLHLLHHRNKNQHRRSVWWRSFSLFRRHLDLLLEDLRFLRTALPITGTTHLARTRKKAEDARRRTRITQRRDFWREVLVARWQHAFSQVVADGRFAVIGVVLMAILAQVVGIVGIVAELEELAEAEVEQALERFAGEEWGLEETAVVRSGLKGALPVTQKVSVTLGEDVGEVIKREEEKPIQLEKAATGKTSTKIQAKQRDSPKPESTVIPSKRRAEEPSTKKSSKKKKKKKKGGDAIDDLFSGLG